MLFICFSRIDTFGIINQNYICILQDIDEQAPDEWKVMQDALSPTAYRSELDQGQKYQLDNWQSKRNTLVQEHTQKTVAKILRDDTKLSRNSTPFVKFLVKACSELTKEKQCKQEAVLTIWNPTEDQINLLQEGCVIRCKNIGVKSSSIYPIQLSATSSTSLEKLSPQPQSSFIKSCGFQQRNYDSLMYTEIKSKRLSFDPTDSVEADCCGCLVKVIEIPTGLLIYLTDKSKCVIRIEREFDHDLNTSLLHWKKGILDLPLGSCLFFKDIGILPFDPWEECAVGYWADISSQHQEIDRSIELQHWYSNGGSTECNFASIKLSCGIVKRTPSKTAILVGSIRSFELLELISEDASEDKSSRLQNFIWAITIDSGSGMFRAAIYPNQQNCFAKVCQNSMIDILHKDFSQDELMILVEYFGASFSSSTNTFRFVVDTESECITQVSKICARNLNNLFAQA